MNKSIKFKSINIKIILKKIRIIYYMKTKKKIYNMRKKLETEEKLFVKKIKIFQKKLYFLTILEWIKVKDQYA